MKKLKKDAKQLHLNKEVVSKINDLGKILGGAMVSAGCSNTCVGNLSFLTACVTCAKCI